MSVNKRSRARVQGSWAAAASQQYPQSKSAAKPTPAADVSKPVFQPNEQVDLEHFITTLNLGCENCFVFLQSAEAGGLVGRNLLKQTVDDLRRLIRMEELVTRSKCVVRLLLIVETTCEKNR